MYRRCGFRYEKKLRATGVVRIAGVEVITPMRRAAAAIVADAVGRQDALDAGIAVVLDEVRGQRAQGEVSFLIRCKSQRRCSPEIAFGL